jgi:hypothetical protein
VPEESIHIIGVLRRKWIRLVCGSFGIISIAIGMLAGVLLHLLSGFSYWWILPLSILCFTGFLLINKSWLITDRDVTRFLDLRYPSMEESAGLLLAKSQGTESLQHLQQIRTAAALRQVYPDIRFPPKIKQSFRFFLMALIISAAVEGLFHLSSFHKTNVSEKIVREPNLSHRLSEISSIHIQITPPAYTRSPSREQELADILIPEGSAVSWKIKTNQSVGELSFIFNDSAKVLLLPENTERTVWGFHSSILSSGFYQVMIDSQSSEHYKLEIIPDLFPEIEVSSPKSRTLLEYGMAEQIPLRVSISDDYGIRSAGITATISNGSGEAVKFREKQMSFDENFQAQTTRYNLQKVLDLNKLGMTPGDELYFYIRATDNHGQEKKSGVFIVALADTAELMNTDLAVSGLNVKPEYFRSERQIILETQQLLADRHSLSREAFDNKSNDLGIDQKMLRLRYGKFLGEEEESGDPGRQSDLGNPVNYGNAAAVLDVYTDKHDNAEDAGYFEKETKDQLKATLTEMWNAELQLRTFKPEAALPYEYKALRLLKDLQQKSRVYVAKTGYKTTPLDFGKRLTGELDKIGNPVEQQMATDPTGTHSDLKEALAVLQSANANIKTDAASIEILQVAGNQLREKAIREPSKWLGAYAALQKLIHSMKEGTAGESADRQLVEKALQNLVKPVAEVPYKMEQSAGGALPEFYFNNLKKSW